MNSPPDAILGGLIYSVDTSRYLSLARSLLHLTFKRLKHALVHFCEWEVVSALLSDILQTANIYPVITSSAARASSYAF